MPDKPTVLRRLREARGLACLACVALGAGLLVSALTPLVLVRLVSRTAPTWSVTATVGLTLLLGLAWIGLGVLIRRGVRWALRTALCVSVLMLAGTLGMFWLSGTGEIPLFPTILAGAATLTCWLAIATEDAARQSKRTPAGSSASASVPHAPRQAADPEVQTQPQ